MNETLTKLLPPFVRAKLEGRDVLKKVAVNIGWLFTDYMFRMAVSFFVMIWVARYLGAEGFGILSYASAFVILFSSLILGLDDIVVREIVSDHNSTDEILGTALILKLIGSLSTIAVATGAIFILRHNDTLTIWLVSILLAATIFQPFDVIGLWFQSQVLSKYTVYARNAAALFASAGRIILILCSAPIFAFALMSFFEASFLAAGLVFAYRRKGLSIGNFTATKMRAWDLLKNGWTLVFSSVFVLVNMHIDKVILREIAGDKVTGLYSAASGLSVLWYFVPVVVGISIMPVLMKEIKRDVLVYNTQLQKVYKLMTIASIPTALLVTLFSDNIISFIYGPEYSGASLMLSVHIWTTLFVFHVSIRSQSFIIEGLQKFVGIYALFTVAFNIALNILLIPDYGGVGAACASLLSWMISVFLLPLFSPKTAKSVKMFFKSFTFISLIRSA